MQFSSLEFIAVFMPIALAGYWLLVRFSSGTFATSWLLLMSIAFYAYASIEGLAIILPSILFDYAVARALLRVDSEKQRLRSALLAIGIAANIALLSYFKYKNFFLDTANSLFATHYEISKALLPLGISFLTFQKIAFLADVHSGQVKSMPIRDFLLFTLFFPRTVAGPIIHYEEVMPQLARTDTQSIANNLAVGVALFSIGLFKKTVIADGIAQFVPSVVTPYSDMPPGLITAWTGMLAYTLQLYFDFSGYSDMALGVARTFGVRLPMNFNSPLRASSIVEFWNRWHISLTRFLTTYVYTPLVMHITRKRMAENKPILRGKRTALSAMIILIGWPTIITMTISGFWHGAGWQFVAWGLLHGIYLTINQCWRMVRPRFWPDQMTYERVMKPAGFVLTFFAVVIALVFFRADSIAAALAVLRGMVGMNGVFSQDIQLLQNIGVEVPWPLRMILQPLTAVYWIVGLLFVATLMPNSLELLRRFQPALDFPESAPIAPTAGPPHILILRSLHTAWASVARLRYQGVILNSVTAVIASLMFVLGVMALNRGGAFLYLEF